jgi:hypothetical protein
MRFYLDTEFIERGYARVELISIGIVAQDGREYYAIASDGWSVTSTDWVTTNVLPFLGTGERKSRARIASEIREFCGPDREYPPKPSRFDPPELWGYFADYDWVLFCQLFGTMLSLPKGFPRFCKDVKQLSSMMGDPPLPRQEKGEHNALEDARHIKKMHEHLMTLERSQRRGQ